MGRSTDGRKQKLLRLVSTGRLSRHELPTHVAIMLMTFRATIKKQNNFSLAHFFFDNSHTNGAKEDESRGPPELTSISKL